MKNQKWNFKPIPLECRVKNTGFKGLKAERRHTSEAVGANSFLSADRKLRANADVAKYSNATVATNQATPHYPLRHFVPWASVLSIDGGFKMVNIWLQQRAWGLMLLSFSSQWFRQKQETDGFTHHGINVHSESAESLHNAIQTFSSSIKVAKCWLMKPTGPTRTEIWMRHQAFNGVWRGAH